MHNGQAGRVVAFHWILMLKLYDGKKSVKDLKRNLYGRICMIEGKIYGIKGTNTVSKCYENTL
ncbi:hypothetical protein GCM10023260_07350 [Bartonella acomydis]|uniref:Uncharacterized protein n=1 Tax=Bartonella acomydis TaxID=686234 RepID=A0ABP9MQ48_9HYPH